MFSSFTINNKKIFFLVFLRNRLDTIDLLYKNVSSKIFLDQEKSYKVINSMLVARFFLIKKEKINSMLAARFFLLNNFFSCARKILLPVLYI